MFLNLGGDNNDTLASQLIIRKVSKDRKSERRCKVKADK